MFELLTDKLTNVFRKLSNKGRLTEKDVDEALREVRLALLEADVNFRVVRDLVNQVRERSLGQEVLRSLTPGQQMVKIVNEQLTAILSGGAHQLVAAAQAPSVIMLVGLQGSGKTTTAAKLALHLRRTGHRALLVAADLRRPAAVEQLVTLGRQSDIPVYGVIGETKVERQKEVIGETNVERQKEQGAASNVVQAARNGVEKARSLGLPWAIVDTGGRLHIDEELMEELQEMKQAISPAEVLLVVDAMTGQDAVTAAAEFHRRLGLTGLILAKLDGDARGGAALSITAVTGVPIKFIGAGERVEALEPFYPDRLASRILGMGDVLSLVEKAQEGIEEEEAKALERKIREATFNLEDFLGQLQRLKKMGPLTQLLEMVPGFSAMKRQASADQVDEASLKRTEAIIYSMTREERRRPEVINGSRRRRIAKGSGTTPQDVNQLLNQFDQMRKMMRQLSTPQGQRRWTRNLR